MRNTTIHKRAGLAIACALGMSITGSAAATAQQAHDLVTPDFMRGSTIAQVAATGSCEQLRQAADQANVHTEAELRTVVREFNYRNAFHNPFGPRIPNPLERLGFVWVENSWAQRNVACGAVTPDPLSIGITLGGIFTSS
ncbi:hypothetical protein [Corynebacterium aquilae]|uniref:Uncharacterized protein n=1 Tax=Corynebacterium aquilae DSM 44791 TaxID=1431546 RepID=A0A1L7CFG7_9CORY|nr:hypothetical protein [Corynebacterium aquilae]APT84589.1 hypothetical protein CAQU_05375 [Corynebacterium aquilae DSM 44791]